jgi:putative endopeptidase
MRFHVKQMSRIRSRAALTTLVLGTCLAVTTNANAIDPSFIDGKADPRVDFVRYANGLWIDKTTIPADAPQYGTFSEIDDALNEKLQMILKTPQTSADGQKLAALYAQGLDTRARNAAGLEPVATQLKAIRQAKSLKQLFSVDQGTGEIALSADPSPSDPTKNVLLLSGPQLGLGGRDQYLATDQSSMQLHKAYISFLAKQLMFAGYPAASAKREAKRVFDLERKMAALYLDQKELASNYQLANVPVTFEALKKLTPSVDWTETASLANLAPSDSVILTESNYLKKHDELFRKAPLLTVKALVVSQLLGAFGPYLSEDLYKLQFDFFGGVLTGQEQPRPFELRVRGQVSNLLPDTIGKLYVDQFFPEAAKSEITTMTKEILAAFRARVAANPWMSAETKAKAIEKVDKVKVRVAYPDRFLTYDEAQLGSNYADSVANVFKLNGRRQLAKVGKPVDESNWGPVAWVNAFYNPSNNTINFPAGILAGGFFDVKNDPAANFGAIGAVIGHELTHGFDISGSQFDGDGRLVSWWSDTDRQQFQALNDRLATQYSALKVAGVGNVDGKLTVGENVADLGGAQAAFDALNVRLAKSPDLGLIDGLTQKQRFFVAWTQAWKSKTRPEFARVLLTQDVHSPDDVRASQPIRNMNAFYEAFGIKEGDPMWLAPAERIVVW